MLILVSVAYFILCVPYGVSEVILAAPDVVGIYDMSVPYWQVRLSLITYVMIHWSALNHVVNFYLYVLGGGKQYRDDVKQIFNFRRSSKS